MSMFNLNHREKVNYFIELIRKRIPNAELQSRFLSDLDKVDEPDSKILFINQNKIEFIDNTGNYYLIFIDEKVVIKTCNRNGNYIEKTEIANKDNYISVRKDSTTLSQGEGTPSYIFRRTDITDYKNNEVVHERTFFTSCSTSIDASDSFTEEKETYVSSDRIAYIRQMTIDDDGLSKVSYHKCCSYNPGHFNDLEEPQKENEAFIYDSNENEYLTSTASLRK